MNIFTIILSFKWKYKLVLSLLVIALSQNSYSQTAKIPSKDSVEVNYKFIVAASQGNVKLVNEYIEQGVFINYQDAQGGTALFYAVNNNYPEVIKTLLYYGSNPNIGTNDGYTPLMAACANGNFDIAQLLLLIKRTNVNIVDNNNISALTYAVYFGHFYIVDMLLFYDASVDLLDKNNNSTLYYAALKGDTAIASRLLKANAKILQQNKDGISPLKTTIQNNDSAMFDLFFDRITPDSLKIKTKQDLLIYSIDNKNSYAFDRLLSDINSDSANFYSDPKILHHAYINEDKGLIKTLHKYNFANSYKPIFTSFQSKFSTSFNGLDYMCYMGIGVRESRYNLDLNVRYGTRFNQFSVTQQQNDNVYYQLWEKRRVLGLQLRKNFLLNPIRGITIKPFVAIDLQAHWGKYNGYSEVISPNFHLVPEAGISIQNQWLVFDISYQYANFAIEGISSNRINFGLGFMIPFYPKPVKYNNVWL